MKHLLTNHCSTPMGFHGAWKPDHSFQGRAEVICCLAGATKVEIRGGWTHFLCIWLCTGNNCVFYIPTQQHYHCLSMRACSLIMFPHRWLKVETKATITLFSLAVDSLSSHFTDLTLLQKETRFPLTALSLPAFMAMLWDVWKVAVPWRCFR